MTMLSGPDGPNAKRDKIGKLLHIAVESFFAGWTIRSGFGVQRAGAAHSSKALEVLDPSDTKGSEALAYWAIRRGNYPETIRDRLCQFLQSAYFLSREDSQYFLERAQRAPFSEYFHAVKQLAQKDSNLPAKLRDLDTNADSIDELRQFLKDRALSRQLTLMRPGNGYIQRHLQEPLKGLTDPKDLLLFGEGIQAIGMTLVGLQDHQHIPVSIFRENAAALRKLCMVKNGTLVCGVLKDLILSRSSKRDAGEVLKRVRDGGYSPFEMGMNYRTAKSALVMTTKLAESYLDLPSHLQTVARDHQIPETAPLYFLAGLKDLHESLQRADCKTDVANLLKNIPAEYRGELMEWLTHHTDSVPLVPALTASELSPAQVYGALLSFNQAYWPHNPTKTVQDTILEGRCKSLQQQASPVLLIVASSLKRLDPSSTSAIERMLLERPDLLQVFARCFELVDEDRPQAAQLAYLVVLSSEHSSGARTTIQKINSCSEERCTAILAMDDPAAFLKSTTAGNIAGQPVSKPRLRDENASKAPSSTSLAATFRRQTTSWQEMMVSQLESNAETGCAPELAREALTIIPKEIQNRLRWVFSNHPSALEIVCNDVIRFWNDPVIPLLFRNQELFEMYVHDLSGAHTGFRAKLLDILHHKHPNPAHALASLVPEGEKARVEDEILVDQTQENVDTRKSFPFNRIVVVGGMEGRGYWQLKTDGYPFRVEFMTAHVQGRIKFNFSKSDFVLMLTDDCDHITYGVAKRAARNAGEFHHYRSGQESLKRFFASCQAASERGDL